MLKPLNHLRRLSFINLPPIHIPRTHLSIKNHYKFSSQGYYNLNTSQFAKEMGLYKYLKKVIKEYKSAYRSNFRTASTTVIIFLMIVGSYLFIQVIDDNQFRLIMYRVNKWRELLCMNVGQKEVLRYKRVSYHEKNLREMFEKNYKERSHVDAQFLGYMGECVEDRLGRMREDAVGEGGNGNKYSYGKCYLSSDVIYIIYKLLYKFHASPYDKWARVKDIILSTTEKLVYYELKNTPETKRFSLLPYNNSKLAQKSARTLLLKGNLNQQLLGLKYIMKMSKTSIDITKPDAITALARLQANKKLYLYSLKVSKRNNSLYQYNTDGQIDEMEARIVSVKEQLLYSIPELKNTNHIRKQKIQLIYSVLTYLIQKMDKKK